MSCTSECVNVTHLHRLSSTWSMGYWQLDCLVMIVHRACRSSCDSSCPWPACSLLGSSPRRGSPAAPRGSERGGAVPAPRGLSATTRASGRSRSRPRSGSRAWGEGPHLSYPASRPSSRSAEYSCGRCSSTGLLTCCTRTGEGEGPKTQDTSRCAAISAQLKAIWGSSVLIT